MGWNEYLWLVDETFDAIGYIVRENDNGEIICKFQPCYFYCQIPLLANSTPLLSNFISLPANSALPASLCDVCLAKNYCSFK